MHDPEYFALLAPPDVVAEGKYKQEHMPEILSSITPENSTVMDQPPWAPDPAKTATEVQADAQAAPERVPCEGCGLPVLPMDGFCNACAAEAELEKPKHSILGALKELADGRKGTLMLVNIETDVAYLVVSFDPKTGKAHLKGEGKMQFHPVITERENARYKPFWR